MKKEIVKILKEETVNMMIINGYDGFISGKDILQLLERIEKRLDGKEFQVINKQSPMTDYALECVSKGKDL